MKFRLVALGLFVLLPDLVSADFREDLEEARILARKAEVVKGARRVELYRRTGRLLEGVLRRYPDLQEAEDLKTGRSVFIWDWAASYFLDVVVPREVSLWKLAGSPLEAARRVGSHAYVLAGLRAMDRTEEHEEELLRFLENHGRSEGQQMDSLESRATALLELALVENLELPDDLRTQLLDEASRHFLEIRDSTVRGVRYVRSDGVANSRLHLVRGYLRLGDLERAERELDLASKVSAREDERREIRRGLLKAELDLRKGRLKRARIALAKLERPIIEKSFGPWLLPRPDVGKLIELSMKVGRDQDLRRSFNEISKEQVTGTVESFRKGWMILGRNARMVEYLSLCRDPDGAMQWAEGLATTALEFLNNSEHNLRRTPKPDEQVFFGRSTRYMTLYKESLGWIARALGRLKRWNELLELLRHPGIAEQDFGSILVMLKELEVPEEVRKFIEDKGPTESSNPGWEFPGFDRTGKDGRLGHWLVELAVYLHHRRRPLAASERIVIRKILDDLIPETASAAQGRLLRRHQKEKVPPVTESVSGWLRPVRVRNAPAGRKEMVERSLRRSSIEHFVRRSFSLPFNRADLFFLEGKDRLLASQYDHSDGRLLWQKVGSSGKGGALDFMPLESVSFSQDGRLVAGTYRADGKYENSPFFLVRDVSTGRELARRSAPVLSNRSPIRFLQDGRLLVVDGQKLLLWDWKRREDVWSVDTEYGGAKALALSRDGRRVAFSHGDGIIQLVSVQRGEPLFELAGHVAGGGRLGICGNSTQAEIDRIQSQEQGYAPYWIAFSRDGRTLFSAAPDDTLHVWDLRRRRIREVHELSESRKGRGSASVLGKIGNRILLGSGRPWSRTLYGIADLELWNLADGARQIRFEGPAFQGWDVSPDGRTLAVGSDRDEVLLIDLPRLLEASEGAELILEPAWR